MGKFYGNQKMHHYMGIEMNSQAWNLLSKDDRTEQDDVRMVNYAHASLYHWKLSPQFEPVNEQRGEWIISRVYAVLSKGDEALNHAKETMRLTEEFKFEDFDLAFAYEAMARAYAALENKVECQKWLEKAMKTGELIAGSEDKKIFTGDLENGPWFGCN